jgi:ligand-binding sensor domain-containing protein
LFRYNGSSFKRYGLAEGLSEPAITSLLVDHEDNIWVGNFNGLFRKVGERMQPVLRDDGRNIDMWAAQGIVVAADGSRYVITGQKAYTLALHAGRTQVQMVFPLSQIDHQPQLAQISSIHAEADSVLWLGCGESLCRKDAAGLMVLGPADGVPADIWRAHHARPHGQLWVRGDNHIIALAPGTPSFINRTPPGDLLRKDNLSTATSRRQSTPYPQQCR